MQKNSCSFAFAIVVFLAIAALILHQIALFFPWWDCAGAPYLYVSFHHNIKGVRKYSRNGCFLSKNILGNHVDEARSVAVHQYRGHEALYVCEARARENTSSIIVYDECDTRGRRRYLKTVAWMGTNPGVNHPYGIDFDSSGNIYASFQHTNVVLRFKKDTFEPMPLPGYITTTLNRTTGFYPGTFFGYDYTGRSKKEGIRDIAFVHGDLWVANEDIHGVSVVSPYGEEIHRIRMRDRAKPIGILFDKDRNLVFISTKSSYGAVYGINAVTRKVEKIYYVDGMTHSTGLTSYGGVLYVAAQDMGKVLSFNIDTTEFLSVVIKHFPDTIEQISLSYC